MHLEIEINESLDDKVEKAISKALAKAKAHWNKSGDDLDELAGSLEMYESISKSANRKKSLEDFWVDDAIGSEARNLVCISADLRNSTGRMKTQLSDLGSYKNKYQRAYFTTCALLAGLEVIIKHYKGFVSEFLGDGVLGFFDAKNNEGTAILKSGEASRYIVGKFSNTLENKLKEYYPKECIRIGVGLAISPTLLSKVGLEGRSEVKAFGPCVYDASKLNFGSNKVHVEPSMEAKWPRSETAGAGISFLSHSCKKRGINYYSIQ